MCTKWFLRRLGSPFKEVCLYGNELKTSKFPTLEVPLYRDTVLPRIIAIFLTNAILYIFLLPINIIN